GGQPGAVAARLRATGVWPPRRRRPWTTGPCRRSAGGGRGCWLWRGRWTPTRGGTGCATRGWGRAPPGCAGRPGRAPGGGWPRPGWAGGGGRGGGAGGEGVGMLKEGQGRHPGDFWLCFTLRNVLRQKGRPREAEGYFRAALAVRPDSAAAHNNLGAALY